MLKFKAMVAVTVLVGAVLTLLASTEAVGEKRRVRIRPSTRNRERHEAIPGLVVSDTDLALDAASSVLRRAEAPGNRLEDDSPAVPIRRRLPTSSSSTSTTDAAGGGAAAAIARRRARLPSRRKPGDVLTPSSKSAVADDPNKSYKVVCYYTNWSQYRPTVGKFMPEDIDPHLCTHVIFAFGWLKKGKLSSFESNDETKDGKVGLYEKIAKLKEGNPELKTLLAIGGWSFGTQKFKDMSKTRYNRQIFIFSAIPFLREHKFDGLDIDWEYPKGKDDKKNYVALLKELREAFDAEAQEFKRPRLLLTAAVPVGPDNVKSGYDVPAVSSYLDFINLMAYDFHGKWEQQAGHNAPLVAPSSDSEWRKQLSVTHAADMWVRLGAPKDKLVIGMPTYGRTFTLTNAANYQVNAPASGGGQAGKYTKESGFLAYYEVCEMLQAGAKYVWDDEMKVPYLVDGDQWVGFDDERAIRNKMQWLKSEGYAGAMVWTLDMDDFTGTVCGGGGKYPLITAMREELNKVPRSPAYKDIDWAKTSQKSEVASKTTLPPPTKISVEELLKSAGLSKNGKTKNRQSLLERAGVDAAEEEDKSLNKPKVFCYFTNWSTRRPGKGRFEPEAIDPFMCTHIVYAFATLQDYVLAPGEDADVGDGFAPGLYSRIQGLREDNPNLKILLAIGGWAFGSKPFKELTENVFRMNTFVYDALEFLREYQFDGLDIDWEYPRGAEDKANYARLVKELRMAFEGEAESSNQPRLILSAAVPASFEAVAAGYDVPEISKYLDYINVMTYDFHGQWERQVGHNSPLFALESASKYQKKLTVDFSAREWVRQGAPKEKLLIGMPTYGRSFTLVDETKFDIGAPASGGGKSGEFTGEEGFLAYYEVCDFLHQDNVTLVWDNEQQVPFAYRQDQWVGFDDERSLKTKMTWLREMGFGGVMIWSVDMDDFRGSCGMGKFPLINAINSGLEGYRVKYLYEGPYDGPSVYQKKKKDPHEVVCEEADGHISYHRDYNDCQRYYMCEGERKHHMPCPSNLVFNPDQSVCDWPENVAHCAHLAPKKDVRR